MQTPTNAGAAHSQRGIKPSIECAANGSERFFIYSNPVVCIPFPDHVGTDKEEYCRCMSVMERQNEITVDAAENRPNPFSLSVTIELLRPSR